MLVPTGGRGIGRGNKKAAPRKARRCLLYSGKGMLQGRAIRESPLRGLPQSRRRAAATAPSEREPRRAAEGILTREKRVTFQALLGPYGGDGTLNGKTGHAPGARSFDFGFAYAQDDKRGGAIWGSRPTRGRRTSDARPYGGWIRISSGATRHLSALRCPKTAEGLR